MSTRATSLFYALSAFVLFTALFVMKPSGVPEVGMLQNEMKAEFSVAFQQTMGDQPYFPEVLAVVEGVSDFYTQAADASIALFEDKQADAEIGHIFAATYRTLANSLSAYVPGISGSSLAQGIPPEEPELNADLAVTEPADEPSGAVSGVSLDVVPVNLEQPWVTIQDNSTTQLYCLAIYNGEVNKYLGPCKNDYH